ncbi:hypothetical protein V1477_019149 [Vespula maculifrons]|uniref:Uncharacterized protein n=1 Tax=Vespula maculifrons TaxID=7453 RepID=A0ABD2ARR0_VESMC
MEQTMFKFFAGTNRKKENKDNGLRMPKNLSVTPNSASAVSTAVSKAVKLTLAAIRTCSNNQDTFNIDEKD